MVASTRRRRGRRRSLTMVQLVVSALLLGLGVSRCVLALAQHKMTIWVAPFSASKAIHHNDTLYDSSLCGSPGMPCLSLAEAIERAKWLRSGSQLLQSGNSMGGAESQQEQIKIVLNATGASHCRILVSMALLSGRGLRSSAVISIAHQALFNVSVEAHLQEGCTHAVLYQPATSGPLLKSTPASSQYILSIESTSFVEFRNIAFNEPDLAGINYGTIVQINSSLAILFDNVFAYVTSSCLRVFHIQNSLMVYFLRPHIVGSERKTHVPEVFESVEKTGAIDLRVDGMNVSQELEDMYPAESDAVLPPLQLIVGDGPECRHLNRSSWTHGMPLTCLPMIGIVGGTFSGLGEPQSVSDQRVESSSVGRAQGVAINMDLRNTMYLSVLVDNCTFTGNKAPLGAVINIRFKSDELESVSSSKVLVRNSKFHGNSGTLGSAMMIHMTGLACPSNFAHVQNCSFLSNVARTEGGALVIFIDCKSSRRSNTVRFANSDFFNNTAGVLGYPVPGGAILIRSNQKVGQYIPGKNHVPTGSSVLLDSCTFTVNKGMGSLHLIKMVAIVRGKTVFADNKGSGIMLSSSYMSVEGSLVMTGNVGFLGGAVRLAQNSIFNASRASQLLLLGNQCSVHGNAVYADIPSSSATIEDVLHSIGQGKDHSNKLQCPIVFPINPVAKKDAITAILSNNTSPNGRENAIFMTSMQRCFDVVRPYLDLSLSSPDDAYAPMCYCMPYVPGDWETRGRVGKTNKHLLKDPQFESLRKKYFGSTNFNEMCLLAGAVTSSSRSVQNSRMNGTASSSSVEYADGMCREGEGFGRNVSEAMLDALRSSVCNRGSATNTRLQQPTRCYSRVQKHFVTNQVGNVADRSSSLGSKPAWIFFRAAETSCFKTVGDQTFYFRDSCFRDGIVREIKRSRQASTVSTDCSLYRLAFLYQRMKNAVTPVLPGYDLILTPWAGMANYWNRGAFVTEQGCRLDAQGKHSASKESIAKLTLSPAPGEEFSLSVDVVDEFFNARPSTIGLRVDTAHGGDPVLLGRNKFIQVPGDDEVYASHIALYNLVLYGTVGATGNLIVTVFGTINYYQLGKMSLVLYIPFTLAPCPPGFSAPLVTTKAEAVIVVDYLNENMRNGLHKDNVSAQAAANMSCRCPVRREDPCIVGCEKGREIVLRKQCWAGDFENMSFTSIYSRKKLLFAEKGSEGDLLNRAQMGNFSFAAEPCDNSRCYVDHTDDTWVLTRDSPCSEWCNCGGVYCSRCLPGFSLLPSSAACVDCRSSVKIPFWLFFTLELIVCFAVVCVLLFLNLGITAPLDSWLFFSQTFIVVFGPSSETSMRFSSNIVTFGLGSLCLSDVALESRLSAQATTLFVPLVLLGMTFSMWLAARRGCCLRVWKHLMVRHSIVHVFWLIILSALSIVSYTCMSMLRCTPLREKMVLFSDGYAECFGALHLPYAIFSIVVLLVVVVPVPLLLLWKPLHIWPALKVFIDEASHIYENKRRWWSAVNIIRRLLLSLVHALVVNGSQRRVAITLCLCCYIALHAVFRPYQRTYKLWVVKDFHNVFELCLLLLLTMLSVLQIVELDVSPMQRGNFDIPPWMSLAAYLFVTLVAFVLCFGHWLVTWRDSIIRRTRRTSQQVYFGQDNDSVCEPVAHRESTACNVHDGPGVGPGAGPGAGGSGGNCEGGDSSTGSRSWESDSGDRHHPHMVARMVQFKTNSDGAGDMGLRDPLLIDTLRNVH